MNDSEIKINILELASALADEMVSAKFEDDESKIFTKENEADECTIFTEEAQEVFNEWYDHYYNLIANHEIKF